MNWPQKGTRRRKKGGGAFVAFLGLFVAIGGSGRAETLVVATYNVENYVATNRLTEDGFRKDYPKPEVQKAALRRTIRALGADVVFLQEMGGAAYLEELQRDLKSEGVDYPHAAVLEAADSDRHVAVLSRRAWTAIERHAGLEYPYFGGREKVKRGLLEVRFATSGGEVTFFALHLKSRFTERPDDPRSALRRVGEAVTIRDAVLARFPDPASARFAILGDFNDDKSSKPLQRLMERGKTVVARLLPAADSRGETWTHAFRKEDVYTRVDHVLVSPGLALAVDGGVARIFDGDGVLGASDHRPVVVTFRFGADRK